jgi:hypothetical protein
VMSALTDGIPAPLDAETYSWILHRIDVNSILVNP